MESCRVCGYVTGPSPLACRPRGSPMLRRVSGFPSSSRLSNRVHGPPIACPFLCQWTPGCREACCGDTGGQISVRVLRSELLCTHPGQRGWVPRQIRASPSAELLDCFPRQLHRLTFPPALAVQCLRSLPALVILLPVFSSSYLHGREVLN